MNNPGYLKELKEFKEIPRPSVSKSGTPPVKKDNTAIGDDESTEYGTLSDTEFSNNVPPSYKTVDYQEDVQAKKKSNSGLCCCSWKQTAVILFVVIIILVVSVVLMLGWAAVHLNNKHKEDDISTQTPEDDTTTQTPGTTTTTTLVQHGWSDWNSWSTCGCTCGGGSRSRTRECEGQYNRCPGPGTQQEVCGTRKCPRPANGQWSTWTGWNDCSLTCGTGIQNRTRSCDMTVAEEDCKGEDSQSRDCNTWECPTCGRTCPDGKNPTVPQCNKCECGYKLTGKVTNTFNLPIKDVIISDSFWPGIELAKSNKNGEFVLRDTCRGIKLSLLKTGHISTTAIVSTSTNKIKMQSVVSLSINKQPESKQRLTGESVTLCCAASGSPPPDYIEWEKDGVYIGTVSSANNGSLVLTDLTTDDDGYYRCRASNDYSSIYSDEAHFIVKNHTDQFCLQNPASKSITLPTGCKYNGKNEIDVGLCPPMPCRGSQTDKGACSEVNKRCCGPKVKEVVKVLCQGFRMQVFVTKSCGCGECIEPVIKIRGNARSRLDNRPLKYGEIYVNGTLVDRTSNNGDFYIEIPKGDKTVAITAIDTNFNEFVTTTKVKEFRNSNQGMYFVFIDLIPMGKDYMLNPLTDTEIDIGGKSPFAKIVIPPNSMYTLTGEKFEGEVQATLNFIDPRSPENARKTPGELSFIDENGRSQLLQTFGMFNMKFRSNETDEELQILDPIRVSLNKSIITGKNLPKLWNMNPDIGLWEDAGNLVMTNNTIYSNHLIQSTAMEEEIIGNVTISVNYWTNFDAYSDEVCHSKVRIFQSNEFNQILQVRDNVEISVLAMTNTEGSQPTASGSKLQSWSDDDGNDNGFCMIHLCHTGQEDTKYNGYILAEYTNKEFMSDEPFQLQPAPADDSSGIDMETMNDINYNTVAVDSSNPAMSVSFDLTQSGSQGPFYPIDNPPSCSKNWACSETCSEADFNQNHFRFYLQNAGDNSCKHDFTVHEEVIIVDEDEKLDPEYLNYLAWFPKAINTTDPNIGELNQYDTCYVKILVNNGEGEVFQGLSKVGNTTYDKGSEGGIVPGETPYGTRELCPESNKSAICLEAKHSGTVHNGLPDTKQTDHTIIHISHMANSSIMCNRTNIDEQLLKLRGHNMIHNSTDSFELYLDANVDYGRDFGIFCVRSKASKEDARYQALAKCKHGSDTEFTSMAAETSTENWAVEFTCYDN